MKSSLTGLLWCTTFVVLDAANAVLVGSILQRVDSFLLGAIVFGISSAVCIGWAGALRPDEIAAAMRNREALVALNVFNAGGWITYLGAVQLIEPAVAFTILSGAIPLATLAATGLGLEEGQGARNGMELLGNIVLAGGLILLGTITLMGLSGFVRGGTVIAAAGIGLSLLSGVLMTGMVLAGYRLDSGGVGPVAQLGLRFPLYMVLAIGGFLLGIDDKGQVPASDLAIAILVGFAVLAFPIYAVQKAITTTSPLTLGTAAAVTPLVVFLFQAIEERVAYSHATGFGLAVYFLGAIVAAAGSIKAVAASRRAPA
jgi:drug/metabolite transporter (DMT)-like permease